TPAVRDGDVDHFLVVRLPILAGEVARGPVDGLAVIRLEDGLLPFLDLRLGRRESLRVERRRRLRLAFAEEAIGVREEAELRLARRGVGDVDQLAGEARFVLVAPTDFHTLVDAAAVLREDRRDLVVAVAGRALQAEAVLPVRDGAPAADTRKAGGAVLVFL